jgi:hypothetical protein
MLSHGAVASRSLREAVDYESFADWQASRVRPETKAALGMLVKLTCQPLEFGPDDMTPLLDLGISPASIEQAVVVGGYIFGYQNRMADAMGADIPKDNVKRAGAMLPDRKADRTMAASGGVIPAEVQNMVSIVVDGPGDSDAALRQAIFRRGTSQLVFAQEDTDISDDLVHYLDTVARYVPDVTDQDIHDLLAAGWSEAEVFEITVAASIAAGYGRLKIAWNALSQAQQQWQ